MIDNFGFPPIIFCEDDINKEKLKDSSKERLYFDPDIKIRRIFTVNKQFEIKPKKVEDNMEEIDDL
jgi:hypothetical protein